jgi:hypothetical protein
MKNAAVLFPPTHHRRRHKLIHVCALSWCWCCCAKGLRARAFTNEQRAELVRVCPLMCVLMPCDSSPHIYDLSHMLLLMMIENTKNKKVKVLALVCLRIEQQHLSEKRSSHKQISIIFPLS